jgi:hypothetical protein
LKRTLKRYKEVPDEIKEACFRRFLQACKHKHALLFFAWREKYAIQRHTGLANAVFQNRMGFIKLRKQKAVKMMGIEEDDLDLLGISRGLNSRKSVLRDQELSPTDQFLSPINV